MADLPALLPGQRYRVTLGHCSSTVPRYRGTWFDVEALDSTTFRVVAGGTRGAQVGLIASVNHGYESIKPIILNGNGVEWAVVPGKEPFKSVPPRADLKWLAVDLDGTLAEPIWTAENPTSEIGDPIPDAVRKVRAAVDQGYKIVVHTSRASTDLENIERWLEHHNIPYRQVHCGKILAAAYVDDRAIHADSPVWYPSEAQKTSQKLSEAQERVLQAADKVRREWGELQTHEYKAFRALFPELGKALDQLRSRTKTAEKIKEGE